MVKEVNFKGKKTEELQSMSHNELAELLSARARRTIKRGFTDQQKKLLEKIKKAQEGTYKRKIRTHCRNMIMLPEMIGATIGIYNGKTFVDINIERDMIGRYFGEFVPTRKFSEHKSPGVGATKSSRAVSVK